ncbi:MAG TPA: lytic transglycosylase domain-containing protein [Stellaceae bacterium]|nr:lytic transglycosylase domain-containing protein [Stellaceae bacterium]
MPPFLALALACAPAVAPVTMTAVARAESAFNPWAIGIVGGPPLVRQPRSRDEAETMARALLAAGHRLDLGLAQVNSANLAPLGLGLADAFDPCRNLRAAATVLVYCYARARRQIAQVQPALQAALSCYNSNSLEAGFANGYVQRVAAGSAQIVPAIDPNYPVPAAPKRRFGILLEPARGAAAGTRTAPLVIVPHRSAGRGVTVLYGGHPE